MIRRLKEDMKKFDGSPCFPPRHVKTLSYRLSQEELVLYDAVTEYVQNNFQRAVAAENRNVGPLAEADGWKFEDEVVERLTMAENMAELEAEIEELDRLVRLAKHTEKN